MLILVLAACSSEPDARPLEALDFSVIPGQAKLYIYVDDGSVDETTFGDKFSIHIDKGYAAELERAHYVEAKLLPGDYVLDSDQIRWMGDTLSHASLKIELLPGRIEFYAVHVLPDDKSEFVHIDSDTGMRAIAARQKNCSC